MRALARGLVALLAVVVVLALTLGWALRRSLPPDDERREVAGLEGPVTLAYDSLGVPTIRATTLNDLAFGQGYAHARDRRFQMELIRRSSAGRLAEIFGPLALQSDREKRMLGFGALADSAFASAAPEHRARLAAYAAGVNAWDASHPVPPEFLALGIPREPWRPQDFALVMASMFSDLQYGGEAERMVEVMDATLPRALVDFLTPEATPLDVVLWNGAAPSAPATPGPEVFDLRRAAPGSEPRKAAARPGAMVAPFAATDPMRGERARGSNNWAVAPSRTKNSRALLAGDPHLGLRVPTIWHRQRLEGPGIAITGITLPGGPHVIIGSNGAVAWSFTNVEGDLVDLVRVRPTDAETTRYAGPAGDEPFGVRREVIRVKGARAETLMVRETRWGPVIGASASGGLLAIQWGALRPGAYDFDMTQEAQARDLPGLFMAFDGFTGPAQNLVAADAGGHIGWRIIGRLPRRSGFDTRRPREAALAGAGWSGEVAQDSMPRVIDPPDGFVVTANQRTVGGNMWRVIGTGAGMPWRARRIHDVLAARHDWDVDGMTALQNDVDDALLGPVARALDRALTPAACSRDSDLAAARRLLGAWDHRADTTSAPHAFLRYARAAIHELLLDPLVAPCLGKDPAFSYSWNLEDEVVRRLLEERPVQLLDPRFADYDALALAAADTAAARLRARAPGTPLDRITWGRINRARIRHPLGAAVPALGRWLNMPDAALAGGSGVVRVARPAAGASMRMVVEPGGETRFSLPGGESGHFLSRHFGDGFADWVAGRYGTLEPGPSRHEIRLTPRR